VAYAQTQPAPADLESIVIRMEQAATASRQQPSPYVLTQEFKIFAGDDDDPKSQVQAVITVVPPASRSFEIVAHSGSSRGEHIVRRLLETESKAANSGDGQVNRRNYNFALLGQTVLEGRRCYLLKLSAKREDQHLVNGQAWVDADTYEVRRIEGDMAKLPSWWLRSVKVTIYFASVRGLWLQTGMTAVAEVRIFGKRTFTSRVISFRNANDADNSDIAIRLRN
jgi:hypothetical protein